MANVVFMGTPEFAVPSLQALLATQTVVGVVTQPDRPAGRGQELRPSPVKVAALQAGVPVYQPASLRRSETAEPIQAWAPDIIVVAAYGHILRPHLLALPPHGCLNIHASLLPRWRGAAPIQHALLAGDAETGVCLMQMEAGLDTGPVFACERTVIGIDDTAATLHDRLAALGGQLLTTHLAAILAGRLTAKPQPEDGSTYAPMIQKEMGRIDWTQPAAQIDRHIRAMSPWPGAFTEWQGQLLKVLAARPAAFADAAWVTGAAFMDGDRLLVQTGDGVLQLLDLQLAGKRATSAAAFVNGRPDFLGAMLGADV